MIFAADPKADIQAPRVFGVPPGVDFPAALVAGLNARSDAARPEMLAHATVYLNTRRMHRRCQTLFEAGPPRLLPRLKLLSVVAPPWDQALPPARDKLTRQLDLTTLISRLIEAAPDLAPPAAAFDLAGSLAALLDEAQGEGVALDKILGLNVADASGHWQRSLQFLRIIAGMEGGEALDPEALQRRKIQALAQYWASFPEERPVIIAGSTGSRGTTALLMQAVARLPQGAIILPGYDFDMDDTQWRRLTHPDAIEDHPQYRFAALLQDLGIGPQDVQPWTDDLAPNPARNRLISLSLCPAPVTDRWLLDGPALGDLRQASDGLSLISAPDAPREALAIALAMRDAVERGKSVALISPDRMLTRRVAAALDRWRITADDSAGEPLAQTAVGRLLRHVAELMGAQTSSEALLVLLKHPACHQGAGRGDHLRLTRDLELHLRRKAVAFPGQADLTRALGDDAAATAWIRWICQILDQLRAAESGSLAELTATLTSTAEALAMGSDPQGELKLWDGKDGSEAHKQLTALSAAAENHPDLQSAFDFRMILRGLLSGEVRDPLASRPDVMIWGTLEARVHGADLVILGGLNEGIWPEQPNPDPWLNRQMRREAGLLSPERRVGLSAHDYQQAVCSGEVILSRAARDAEAETVPSRWLNRLLNLLGGLPDQHGDAALAAMQARGTVWTDLAAQQDRPAHRLPPSPRPAPAPPAQARPRNYRATEIETLIRDPYQIYARKILKLHPLDGLRQRPEARLRGTLFHEVLETFLPLYPDLPENAQQEALLDIAAQILAQNLPWPAAQRLWLAHLRLASARFLQDEAQRQILGTPIAQERSGRLEIGGLGVEISGKVDRVDVTSTGEYVIYDYKSGSPPGKNEQKFFAKQLRLMAMMAEEGGFGDLPAAPVAHAAYLGLGRLPKTVAGELDSPSMPEFRAQLIALLTRYLDPATGFTAQIARRNKGEFNDYDQLSRAGEWDLSQPAEVTPVGEQDA